MNVWLIHGFVNEVKIILYNDKQTIVENDTIKQPTAEAILEILPPKEEIKLVRLSGNTGVLKEISETLESQDVKIEWE